MCAVFKSLRKTASRLFVVDSELEEYLRGATTLSEIENRQRDWLARNHEDIW